MAGALLKFSGGYLGFERCVSPDDGKEYLRAVVHSDSSGRTTSAPVTIAEAFQFATDVMKQALLADGEVEK